MEQTDSALNVRAAGTVARFNLCSNLDPLAINLARARTGAARGCRKRNCGEAQHEDAAVSHLGIFPLKADDCIADRVDLCRRCGRLTKQS
jgi:hypothetical protein